MVLLAHFVGNSSSLHGQDQNWVPVCLPGFNARALLQAYICTLRIADPAAAVEQEKGERGATSTSTGAGYAFADISLILISASADPAVFPGLHAARGELERSLQKPSSTAAKLVQSVRNSNQAGGSGGSRGLQELLARCKAEHFLFKQNTRRGLSPAAAAELRTQADVDTAEAAAAHATATLPPAQWAATEAAFPFDSATSIHRLWANYQRLSVYLRIGTATPESTLHGVCFPDLPFAADAADSAGSGSSRYIQNNKNNWNVLAFAPASDHALAYIKSADGFIIVGIATSDTELYVTFCDCIGAVAACGNANALSRLLKTECSAGNVFQTSL